MTRSNFPVALFSLGFCLNKDWELSTTKFKSFLVVVTKQFSSICTRTVLSNSVLSLNSFIFDKNVCFSNYYKYYPHGIVVFLVSNAHVDSKLLTDYYWV